MADAARLAQESGPIYLFAQILRQKLERHSALQHNIERLVDDAHAALARML